ncbi:uncharacterized protein [Prorops nasuta]|uniref:uncharacterized protein n=1 Tax=Prorops nasuta TaxID=863751 RepID=UPI0034CDABAE
MAVQIVQQFHKLKTALKGQITQLTNLVVQRDLDTINLRLRYDKLFEKYNNFENIHDDLILNSEDEVISEEFIDIQNKFYTIATTIKRIIEPEVQTNTNQPIINCVENSAQSTTRRVKLPLADLPKFDGSYEKWYSFKNTFQSMIDARDDLNNVEKLIHLRSGLIVKAAEKIVIYDDSSENYQKAWDFLQKSYEVQRLIVSRHLRAICEFPKLKTETHDGLIELSDTMQQHHSALESLGASVGCDMFVYLIEQKLPYETSQKWELELKNDELPTLGKLCDFMAQTAIRVSKRELPESISNDINSQKVQPPTKKHKGSGKVHAFVSNVSNACIICQQQHYLFQCQDFIKLSVPKRIDAIKRAKHCSNCLRKHPGACHSSNSSDNLRIRRQPLIMSAMIRAQNKEGNFVRGRALLDTCATAHFVTEEFAKRLNLPRQPCKLSINTISSMSATTSHSVQITFRSIYSDYQKTLTFLTVSNIANLVPSEIFPRNSISITRGLQLADPQFYLPRPVDILIGSGATLSMFSIGQINLSNNSSDLILQKTQLGWVIAGDSVNATSFHNINCDLLGLSEQLSAFWKIEEPGFVESQSTEEAVCEKHYVQTVSRDNTGKYIVRLPFRENVIKEFGDMRIIALRRLNMLERKFHNDAEFKKGYSKIMQEYLDLGHMSEITDIDNDGYYMPHHGVLKLSSATTKLRIVFDASAKTRSGVSLNETLMTGPTIQDKIFDLLIRFRFHKYVLTADIEKIVTFGVSAAPFLAIRTIQKLADDEALRFPIAARILKRDLYVDDLITGAETIKEIQGIQDEIVDLLNCGGFKIRQWASNDKQSLVGLADKLTDTEMGLSKETIHKTLRMF